MEKDLSSLYSQEKDEEDHESLFDIKLHRSVLEPSLQSDLSLLDGNKSLSQWSDDVFTQSVIYYGSDDFIWGEFLMCVYKSPSSNKLNAIVFDKLGMSCFESVDISSDSQYYPAIENLSPKDQESNVKKCMAVVLLQRYPLLSTSDLSRILSNPSECDYDPPHAGDLASSCELITAVPPEEVGKRLFISGLLQNRLISSALLDVIYENNESTIELNNRLVFHLGEQLEQLFNPVTEYSPEQTEYGYKAPDDDRPTESDDVLVKAICNELLQVQTNFTFNLVGFLQKILIALRVRVLNDEIDGLSTAKLNRLFPPTIDEVTRINCIFLDSLKTATPYGSLEVLKACSITIPYFYKAYTRHEAATKNFSKDIKLFSRHFSSIIPEKEVYTEMKIESIIKGPQEKLLKLKLIVERLWKSKKWKPENQEMAKKCYDNVIDVIDSFGKLDSPMHSYNTRVFTPSGKILTELAKGWPVELQYKWLKRRVVGVYDVVDINDENKRNLLVIFSDYVVFINVLEAETYYTQDGSNRPFISDILMNSLINEVPLPTKIPKLKVEHHCYIDEILVSILDENSLRFDCLKGKDSFSVVCKLSSTFITSSSVADLITKARILEKDTAFHLFKASRSHFTLYSTAHELCAYDTEKIKSKFALFLNIPPSEKILELNNLHLALFAKFSRNGDSNNLIRLDILTKHGSKHVEIVSNNIVSTIINQLAIEIPICYSSLMSPMAKDLLFVNENLIKDLKHQLKAVKHNSANGSKTTSSKVSDVSDFNSAHEKKRSYGTITTFRSYTSDLKDRSLAGKDKFAKEGKQILPVKPTKKPRETSSKKKMVGNNSKTNQIENKTTKKSKGFFGTLKTVFGTKKNSKSSSVQKDPKKRPQVPSKSPAKKVVSEKKPKTDAAVSLPNKKKKNTPHSVGKPQYTKPPLEATEFKSSDSFRKPSDIRKYSNPQKKTRISSVVRDSNFASYTPPQPSTESSSIREHAESKEDQNPRKDHPSNPTIVTGSLPTCSENLDVEKDDQVIKKIGQASQIPENGLLSEFIQMPTANKINAGLTNEQNNDTQNQTRGVEDVSNSSAKDERKHNESRVFNDDLFGDFIPKRPNSEDEDISGSNNLFEKGETPEEKVVISANSNISSRVDDNSSTLMQKTSLQLSKVPTKNSSGSKYTPNEAEYIASKEESKGEALTKEMDRRKLLVKERIEKQGIFPTIPKLAPLTSKISFQKSPSYIELFQGMRVVLDKHDAHYNWRRLASQVSLSEGMKVNTEEDAAIVNEPHVELKKMPQISEIVDNKIQQPIPTHSSIRNSDTSSNDDSVDEFFEIEEELKEELKGAIDVNQDESHKNLSNPVPKIEKPPVFKVIRTSPVRIIGKTLEDIRKDEDAFPSDASCIYDPHNEGKPDKRLMELKFPSQDEIQDDKFYTPAEEPTAAFPVVERPNISENCNTPVLNDKTTESSFVNNSEDKPSELLDDLEFSSFNIAFGNSSMSADNVKVASDRSLNKTLLGNSTKVQESPKGPLVYVLPNNSTNRKGDGCLRKKDNDEPIWVSPSKIDFTYLSKRTESILPELSAVLLKKNNDKKAINTREESIGSMTNMLLSKDASYAYLTDFVTISDDEDEGGKKSYVAADGPERLKFY
ncbi:bud3p [Saccharomyces arboricola H-6]|uniref:Bud3p n=1 Tax=Saccharomyces arboricola (strain H-6 / AS 2.3317 / CBS 10644) TaxID=1160507 RepID=J8LQY4_SACAR|nr:bud3p [Saccharomyces arboricola H-6]